MIFKLSFFLCKSPTKWNCRFAYLKNILEEVKNRAQYCPKPKVNIKRDLSLEIIKQESFLHFQATKNCIFKYFDCSACMYVYNKEGYRGQLYFLYNSTAIRVESDGNAAVWSCAMGWPCLHECREEGQLCSDPSNFCILPGFIKTAACY